MLACLLLAFFLIDYYKLAFDSPLPKQKVGITQPIYSFISLIAQFDQSKKIPHFIFCST